MNSLLENDDEFARGDRELTLSTGSILAIFLGLVLLCGLFFGWGYKMGSHKAAPVAEVEASNTTASPAAPTADFNGSKPAAGSPAAGSASKPTVSVPVGPGDATASAHAPVPRSATNGSASPATEVAPTLSAQPAGAAGRSSGSASTGDFVVQVAAVTLQEDANLLVGALGSKGYVATEHAQPDKLIHIQVGPFGTRKDADAMRQRLLSDGYNAIVK
jgi:DedD protein